MKKKDVNRLLEIIEATRAYISHENGYSPKNKPVHADMGDALKLLELYKAEKRVKKPIIKKIISKETIDQVKEFDELLTLVDEKMDGLYSKFFGCEQIKEVPLSSFFGRHMSLVTPYTAEKLAEFYSITKSTTNHGMVLEQFKKAGITSLSNINTLIKMGYCNI